MFVKSAIGYAHSWSPEGPGLEIDRNVTLDAYDLIMNYYDSAINSNAKGIVKLHYT